MDRQITVNKNNDKNVLKKMVFMYIRENIDTNIHKIENIDRIVEEVIKELLTTNKSKKPIYVEMPITYDNDENHETNILIRPPSPPAISINIQSQRVCCINRQSIIFRLITKIYDFFIEKFNNQETYQRYQAISSILIELFRVITSSLMILFVPQKCDKDICTFQQTMRFNNGMNGIGLIINFITLGAFIILYWIEMWRENRLIKYLDVNPNMPTDPEYISNIMNILSEEKINKIHISSKYYRFFTYFTIIIYIINAIISGIIIDRAYLSNQTYATYITYVIFMITKLTNAYTVVNTDEHVYYSAYLKTNVQFNDIDRNYKNIMDL